MTFESDITRKRLPEWLKTGLIDSDKTRTVRRLLKELHLNTVCDGARCPNKCECYSQNTATFMILGDKCTRNCKFCAVEHDCSPVLSSEEPANVAEAVKKLKLRYVVVTSVTRDDLEDGGAAYFVDTVKRIKGMDKEILVEVLVPDFRGNLFALERVLDAGVDVLNHNIETVKLLYEKARPQADYQRSLDLLRHSKEYRSDIITKSGFMVGLGETEPQIIQLCQDLFSHKCDVVTIGQYIQPTKNSLMVEKYYTEDEFLHIKQMIRHLGFKQIIAGPLVRSSYKAFEAYQKASSFCQ